MKLILFFYFCVSLAFAQIDKPLDREVDNLLGLIEVTKFVESIGKIKSYKDPGEIDEMDYQMKIFFNKIDFWFYFDHLDYQSSLKRNLRITFSITEIKRLQQLFKNPFYLKVLKNLTIYRDVFQEYHNMVLLEKKPSALMESRYQLIENYYNILGLSVQYDMAQKRINQLIGAGKVTITMLGKKDNMTIIDANGLEKRQKNLKDYLIKVLGERLSGFRHYELREFFRIMRKEPELKKFTQLYVNFHYMYLVNYLKKVEADKIKQIKALSVEGSA